MKSEGLHFSQVLIFYLKSTVVVYRCSYAKNSYDPNC